MNILITGASSYVGARIYSDLNLDGVQVIGTYATNSKVLRRLWHMDVTKKDSVDKVVETCCPEIIIHVAAIAAQQGLKDIELTKQVNVGGTKNIVEAANRAQAKVIYLSSFAAIWPSNLYGETKKAAEEIVEGTETGYVILRPCLIIGQSPNTKNDRFHNRLINDYVVGGTTKPVHYDTSWRFQPTWLGHISECINLIVARDQTAEEVKNETIPIAVQELKTRYDLAKDLLSHFGMKVIPEDKNDQTPFLDIPLTKLTELSLPQYTYEDIISKTLEEFIDYM